MSARPRVLVTGADLANEALAILAPCEVVYAGKAPSEDDMVALCERHQPAGIIVRYGRIPARVMDASKALRVIAKHGVGLDTIDVAAAKARGIAVRAAVGANADAVAEHAWALILACAKGIVPMNERMHAGHWDKATHKSLELNGKTLGVVGLGAIGRRVAAIGAAFGMAVVAFDPFVTEPPDGVVLGTLDEVFAASRVLSLNCPLVPESRHLVNRRTLALLPAGAIVVNTGRGGLVDDAALREALASGHVRGAGLDSFDPEPLVGDHAWRNVPRAVLTPHVGGVSEDAYVKMGVGAARHVIAELDRLAA